MERETSEELAAIKYYSQFKPTAEALKERYPTWVGPDIPVSQEVTVPAEGRGLIGVVVNKESFPHLRTIEVNRTMFRHLRVSTRSFYAQTGISISVGPDLVTEEMVEEINKGKDVVIPVLVENHGQRDVHLDQDVMRLFWAPTACGIKGEELEHKVNDAGFEIDGTEGEDWFLIDANGNQVKSGDEKAERVVVRLKPERFRVKKDSTPVKKDSGLGTRENLDQILEPIPENEVGVFEIGETPKIKLGPNTLAVIELGAYDEGELGVAHHGQRHINSPLIDPGFEGTIRTEISSHGGRATHVEFELHTVK